MNIIDKLKKYNVEIIDEEKLLRYLNEKSHFRYNQILEKLLDYRRNLTDTHLNDFYRYDIRLRRLLFKYLTVYEITLRGKVLNEIDQGFEEVERLTFGQLIGRYYFTQPELRFVKDLRNLIFHHRMIQLEDEVVIIDAMNIMLKNLDILKFYHELEKIKENLLLIKAFCLVGGRIKYDYVRSD